MTIRLLRNITLHFVRDVQHNYCDVCGKLFEDFSIDDKFTSDEGHYGDRLYHVKFDSVKYVSCRMESRLFKGHTVVGGFKL